MTGHGGKDESRRTDIGWKNLEGSTGLAVDGREDRTELA